MNDSKKREIYDQYGAEAAKNGGMGGGFGGQQGGPDFSDFFGGRGGGGPGGFDMNDMFGGGRQQQQRRTKANPITLQFQISLEDVQNGKFQKIKYSKTFICSSCNGKGGSKVKTCTPCQGTGHVTQHVQVGPGMYTQRTSPCSPCGGTGEIIHPENVCKTCTGKKVVRDTKEIEIQIEKGIPNGEVVTMAAMGNELPGSETGDLVLQISVAKHKVFSRIGADLYMNKTISLKDALLGFNFVVEALDGEKIAV